MRTLTIAAVAMLMVACGGSSNSSSHSTPTPTKGALFSNVDACKLVTAADASTAVGTTVANAAGAAAFPGACFYASSDGSASVLAFAQAEADATAAKNVDPNQITAAFAGAYGIKNAHQVEGIGDKAFEYTATSSQTNSNGIAIFVFKANVLLFIVMSPSTESAKIEALAKTAVSRLS